LTEPHPPRRPPAPGAGPCCCGRISAWGRECRAAARLRAASCIAGATDGGPRAPAAAAGVLAQGACPAGVSPGSAGRVKPQGCRGSPNGAGRPAGAPRGGRNGGVARRAGRGSLLGRSARCRQDVMAGLWRAHWGPPAGGARRASRPPPSGARRPHHHVGPSPATAPRFPLPPGPRGARGGKRGLRRARRRPPGAGALRRPRRPPPRRRNGVAPKQPPGRGGGRLAARGLARRGACNQARRQCGGIAFGAAGARRGPCAPPGTWVHVTGQARGSCWLGRTRGTPLPPPPRPCRHRRRHQRSAQPKATAKGQKPSQRRDVYTRGRGRAPRNGARAPRPQRAGRLYTRLGYSITRTVAPRLLGGRFFRNLARTAPALPWARITLPHITRSLVPCFSAWAR
jgi:hypothetical protein